MDDNMQIDKPVAGGGDQDSPDSKPLNDSNVDAKKLSTRTGSHQTKTSVPQGSVVQSKEDFFANTYKMDYSRRGVALIINNKKFHVSTGLNDRNGTDVDASALACRFAELGFEPEIRHNQSAKEITETISQFASSDHSDADCFVCAILSHGEEGTIWGTDRQIKVDDLFAPFKGDVCPSLAGKPKLFFIQACRGTKFDCGADMNVADAIGFMEQDISMETHRIPAEADFLVAYSVVPGFYSWRNSADGSWFVQALSSVLEEHGTELDLMKMMTRVNQRVALQFQSNTSNPNLSGKKTNPMYYLNAHKGCLLPT